MALSFRRTAMGCEFGLILDGLPEQALIDTSVEAWELLERLDGLLSHYRPKSEVSYVNAIAAEEPVLLSPELFDLVLFARDMWGLTDGYMDITVGPLARAWGFFAGDQGGPPAGVVDSARRVIGFHHLRLDPEQRLIQFDRPGVEIGFAALGKGYALDRIADLLRERGVPEAFVTAGGSSAYGFGRNEGWGVRVTHPQDEGLELERLLLHDQGLSTSGPSQQSVWVEGVRRSHLIDPRVGEPCSPAVTAVVVAKSALEAEALSTAAAVSASPDALPDWLISYISQAPDVRVWLIEPHNGHTKTVQLATDPRGNPERTENAFPVSLRRATHQ